MHESRKEQSARRLASWFDPEALLYGLVGLFVVVLGARQLAGWVADSWVEGHRALAASALGSLVITVGALLFTMRRQRRWLILGIVLVAVGFVSYLLASVGFTLPPSWLQ
jgi:sugar phosphate permease